MLQNYKIIWIFPYFFVTLQSNNLIIMLRKTDGIELEIHPRLWKKVRESRRPKEASTE